MEDRLPAKETSDQPTAKSVEENSVVIMDGDTVIGLFDPTGLPPSKRTRRKLKPVKREREPSVQVYWSPDDPIDDVPTDRTLNNWGCPMCQKTFASRSNLQIHSSIHSGERYVCATCKRCFTQKCNLKRHEAIHLGKKLFSCVRCSKRFTQKANLQRHFIIHSGTKNFTCVECGKGFIQKCNLKKHLEKHTEKTSFPFVECLLYEESSS